MLYTRSIYNGEGQGAEYKIYYQRRGAGCCIQDLLSKERGRVLNTRSIIKGEGQSLTKLSLGGNIPAQGEFSQ